MKFGFDLDGTITAFPDQFRAIMRALIHNDHEVHVISGAYLDASGPTSNPAHHKELKKRQLAELNIIYTELHVVPVRVQDDAEIGRGKRTVCEDLGIVFYFEDRQGQAVMVNGACPTFLRVGH